MLEIIPFAKQYPKQMKQKGKYKTPNGMPKGLITHFAVNADGTPDNPNNWGTGVMSYGISMGYSFLYIDRDGELWQAAPLSQWGNHAGASAYPGFVGEVSDECAGVEMAGYGRLIKKGDKFFSCYGNEVPKEDVRYFKGGPRQVEGWYHKFTVPQEAKLEKLALWMRENDPTNFQLAYVLGHDEVAQPFGRKNDPGGSLSLPMPEYRKYLKAKWAELNKPQAI